MVRAVNRAPYASNPEKSRGRLHPEPESDMRSPFQRDRDRIIHATAFRRLKHKTQVFVYHEGDHYRTRLTHSHEVAQIARTIARALGLDEDIAEAVGLAHDLGHTPFGHAGEDALNAEMQPFGGFSHNDQTLRILTSLERGYAGLDETRLIHESIRRLIDRMVRDLVAETGKRLAASGAKTVEDVRRLGEPVAAFSQLMRNHDRALKRFLSERMYRHYRVNRMSSKARRVVRELFQLFLAEPECLPGEWRALTRGKAPETARIVADYLAGMTDRFALDEHRRLFDTYASV